MTSFSDSPQAPHDTTRHTNVWAGNPVHTRVYSGQTWCTPTSISKPITWREKSHNGTFGPSHLLDIGRVRWYTFSRTQSQSDNKLRVFNGMTMICCRPKEVNPWRSARHPDCLYLSLTNKNGEEEKKTLIHIHALSLREQRRWGDGITAEALNW
jgi:hypothetical protein